jgi:hypothetical protein
LSSTGSAPSLNSTGQPGAGLWPPPWARRFAACESRRAAALGVTAEYLVDPKESTPRPDVVDEAFFRKYRNMDPATKERIRQMVEVWGRDDK